MSHDAMAWAIKQRTGSPARKAVLMNLADRADEAWSCFPGQKRIAADTELGERTVRRALDDLETEGLLLRFHRRRGDGSWTSDRYVLAGYVTDPDAVRLLADSDTSGQSGRRPKRPAATAAAHPAATAAGHESPVTNPQPPSPTEREGAHAHGDTPEHEHEPAHEDPTPQIALVGAPAKPAPARRRAKTEIPADWQPSEALCAWTRETAPGMPRSEVAAFIDRHRSRGETFADHDAAWRTWVRNWVRYGNRGARPGAPRPGPYRDNGWKDGTSQASWDRFMETGGTDR